MIPAIYARKSTLQRGDEETKSVARQIAHAREFAARRGLPPIADAHVYVDDAVSGADIRNLKARARLNADVNAGHISTVIMADMSRFSRREGYEVVAELEQIARKAAVYFYETGEQYTFGDIGSNISNFARAESNADYRRKVCTKTISSMFDRAKRGHVLGGHCFGYRHADVLTGATDASGRPIRSHVTRKVHEPEAAVVREIYERYAAGQGFKKIADALNRKGVPTPRPRPGRRPSWAISSVRSALRQPLYRGIARWNRLKQHDDRGNRMYGVNPEGEQVTFVNPEWRIVPEALCEAVDARFADETRCRFGFTPGATAKYLLSGGLLVCPDCGGRFEAVNGRVYTCATRRRSGPSVCSNALRLRIREFDDLVLGLLDGEVLHPRFVELVLNRAWGSRQDDGHAEVEAQRDELTAAINRLLALAESGAEDVAELAGRIKARKAERDALERRLASMDAPADREGLRAALEQRCDDWRHRLRSENPDEARFVVQQLIGPLTLWSGSGEDVPPPYAARGEQRGAEAIGFEDCGFAATVTPAGLLNGLCAHIVVAGARNRRYLQLWRGAA